MVAAIGAMLRAAELHMVILVDGFIMTACALAAKDGIFFVDDGLKARLLRVDSRRKASHASAYNDYLLFHLRFPKRRSILRKMLIKSR